MTSPTHALIAIGIGSFVVPRDLDRARAQLMVGACCAVLPDLDLVSFIFLPTAVVSLVVLKMRRIRLFGS